MLQHGFKMFLGIMPVVTNWSPAGDEFSLLIENNPLIDFVELPEGHNRLNYSNILCGALRGALEMVRISCWRFMLHFKVCAVLSCKMIWSSTQQNLHSFLLLGFIDLIFRCLFTLPLFFIADTSW